ncbi:MAG: hypothetical protein IKI29_00005, partial [Clostridia bacterium]|nr:hypothetical protein [Clostridia bacterium]
VDSDDWIDAETCEVMYHALVTEHADIVQCSYVKEFGNHTNVVHVKDGNCVFAGQAVRDKVLLRLYGQLGEQLARPQEMDLPVAPWMQLFRKKMVDGIKFVDIKTVGSAEDLIFQVNAYVRCQKYVYLDRPFFHYRRSDMTTMTTTHTEDKYERWENLYDILEKTIETNGLDDRFRAALQNRVAVGLIGLGLNEIYSHRSRTADAKRLQEILTNPRYEAALHRLPFDYFPIHWRLFFRLCKKKKTRLLVELLHIMEFLRRKIR